jgi:hypothetical protein
MTSVMLMALPNEYLKLIFQQPSNDGRFDEESARIAGSLGAKRPLVILPFAPKAAGTFFRSALIKAINGQLVRVVHAQGGRDAQPHLPIFVEYFTSRGSPKTLVAHIHMQALPANTYFLEAFRLKPVIMLRNIADMMASYWDMLESADHVRDMGVNFHVPGDFAQWQAVEKQEFLIDILLPWYASYFASWGDYVARAPQNVMVLRFTDFLAAPITSMRDALRHSGLDTTEDSCRHAFDAVWASRSKLRYNEGRIGRGKEYFTPGQCDHISKVVARYRDLGDWHAELLS